MDPMNWNNTRKFEPVLFFRLFLAVCSRGNVTKSSCFEFWGQDDIQTSHPTPWRSQCRLWFYLKSARAVNVAIFCFIWALLYTRNFSVAYKPLMKREYPRNVWLTTTMFLRKLELSFIFHPFDYAAQFFRIFIGSITLACSSQPKQNSRNIPC